MTVIGITGFAQVGKDTAAGFLIEQGFTRLAFADILRESVYNLNPIVEMPLPDAPDHWARVQDLVDWKGWDVAKVEYPEIRGLLQRMGTEVGRDLYGENFWVDRVMAQIDPKGDYVITDVRFPNEAEAVRAIGGQLWRIERPGVRGINAHVSEAHVTSILVDVIIPNTGDMDHYRQVVLHAAGLELD